MSEGVRNDSSRARPASMYKSGQMADVTLVAVAPDGTKQTFQVNRAIMARNSDYWEKLLGTADFLEKRTTTVTIPDIQPRILDMVLQVCYDGALENIDPESHILLISAADRFCMEQFESRLVKELFDSRLTYTDNQDLLIRIFLGSLQAEEKTGEEENESENEENEEKSEKEKGTAKEPEKRKRGRKTVESTPKRAKREKENEKGDKGPTGHVPLFCSNAKVRNYCTDLVLANASFVLEDKEILHRLPAGAMKLLLSHDYADAKEIVFFRAAMEWCKSTGEKFQEVAECVRYPLMSSEEFAEVCKADVLDKKGYRMLVRVLQRTRTESAAKEPIECPKSWMVPRLTNRLEAKITFPETFSGQKTDRMEFSSCGFDWLVYCEFAKARDTDNFVVHVRPKYRVVDSAHSTYVCAVGMQWKGMPFKQRPQFLHHSDYFRSMSESCRFVFAPTKEAVGKLKEKTNGEITLYVGVYVKLAG
eukprot:comp20054_c0_seq1/m.24644 comp20054_c0_seq1/g.24644  ORF comp20054_c0_seq1/g.24644 comp20054_c0_seq1/m.24644 type:complete len:476 (-) comp20054_c0_seq1:46-1473(-)